MRLTIRAPATSANLGPGFDCLGLALDLWATVEVDTDARSSKNGDSGAARLVRQGIDAAFDHVGKAPNAAISWDAAVPIARGLGASAALRAAGLLAGNALLDNVHPPDELLELGTKIEGHPDNMAPCLFGGLQVSVHGADGVVHLESPLPAGLQVVLYVPEFEMPTQETRRRLPKQVSREDAVFNLGHTALLVAALAAGRFDLLDEATQDRIHQPSRAEVFAGLNPIIAAAKDGGAAAAYLSGAGSTVAALVQSDAERVARLMTQAAVAGGFRGRSIITQPTSQGAHLV